MLKSKIECLLKAIDLLIDKHLQGPALIMIYSTIDILAWLNRNENHKDVTKSDFSVWVDKYLLPTKNLDVSSVDLHSARCSLLHSYTSESSLSREGKAKEIFYSWGNFTNDGLQTIIDSTDRGAIAIQIEDLVKALMSGSQRFVDENLHSEIVCEHAGKLFINAQI